MKSYWLEKFRKYWKFCQAFWKWILSYLLFVSFANAAVLWFSARLSWDQYTWLSDKTSCQPRTFSNYKCDQTTEEKVLLNKKIFLYKNRVDRAWSPSVSFQLFLLCLQNMILERSAGFVENELPNLHFIGLFEWQTVMRRYCRIWDRCMSDDQYLLSGDSENMSKSSKN